MSGRRLDFDVVYRDGLTMGRLLAQFGGGVVERHWDGLHRASADRDRNPYFTHAVNNNNTEEVAVYLGLVWSLTEGRTRSAMPMGTFDRAREQSRREDFELVRWDYRIDAEQWEWAARDVGFTKATYPIERDMLRGPTSPGVAHPAGVFPVRDRNELTAVLVSYLGDVWTSIMVIGVRPDHSVPAHERLRDRRRPTWRRLLRDGDVVGVVTIGADLGTWDSLLLVMDGDRRDDLARTLHATRRRIHAYEATLDAVRSPAELLPALDFLQGRPVISDPRGYDNLHRWLLAEIPTLTELVTEHIRDNFGEVLPHVLMGDVVRFVKARREAGDDDTVTTVLRALDTALGAVDGRTVNVAAVSFVENFEPWLPASREFISRWPERLRREAERQRDWAPDR